MTPDIMLAKSLAGHDKNHIYLVYKIEEDFYYLVNGTTKTIDAPKKKKKMHLQVIKKLPARVLEVMADNSEVDDMLAKKILERYQEEENCQKQM